MCRRRSGQDVAARTLARVDEAHPPEFFKRLLIKFRTIALPTVAASRAKGIGRGGIGIETQPVEIVEDRVLELGPASLAIVIFDPQQHAAAKRSRHPPHVERIHDVTEMQAAGRGGSKTRDHEKTYGSRFGVLGSRFSVLGSWFLVLGS